LNSFAKDKKRIETKKLPLSGEFKFTLKFCQVFL
jgi:hypothetical protein